MKKLEQRITGTEMEYSVLGSKNEEQALAPIDSSFIRRLIANYMPEGIKRAGDHTSNGARVYPDVGYFAEYATPEDASFWGTVTNEIAGERIIQRIFQNAKDAGELYDFAINKRVLSDDGQSWGYHANFIADASKLAITEKCLSVLALHVVSATPYTGAGGVWQKHLYDSKPQFSLAQKMFDRNCNASSSTHTVNKPIISLRDEPLSFDKRFVRVHVPSMDANMSPWQTWMKLGTTSIVLRLIENGYHGEKADDIMLSPKIAPYVFGHRVAQDPTMQYAAYNLDHSGHLRALDIQRKLLGHAALLDLPAQELEVWHEWERTLDTLEENPLGLGRLVDWTSKYEIIERAQEIYSTEDSVYPINGNRIRHALRSYDSLDKSKSMGIGRRSKNPQVLWTPPEAEIARAVTSPPQNTRAKLRGNFIRDYANNERKIAVHWSGVAFIADPAKGTHNRSYQISPYQTKWPEDNQPKP